MMYIANMPLRIGGVLYRIGEVIHESKIDPTMVNRLIGWGKIIKADFPAPIVNVSAETPPNAEDDKIAYARDETPANTTETPPESFVCDICGKSFGSQHALSAHKKAHKS